MKQLTAAIAVALALASWAPPAFSQEKLPPNIVFILADDLGWTGLSVPSHPEIAESGSDFYRTPRLAALARQGMAFSQAYSPGPMCTPSRAALLTGKSPAQLRVTSPGRPKKAVPYQKLVQPAHVMGLPTDETTIAEILKQRNYVSAHFGKWHLSNGGPGRHGFDVHDGETANAGPGAYEDPNPKDVFGITRRAITFMTAQAQAKKPFYLQLSHYAVHEPHLALGETMSKAAKRPRGRRHSDVTYAAMTEDLDAGTGLLLEKIDELGIADNTYVVFTSDNGAAGGRRAKRGENLPLAGGKGTLKEGGIRVPLICRGPGVKSGVYCSQGVTGVDLFATFCQWAGIRDLPDCVEGTSLVPLLTGRGTFRRTPKELVFHYPHYALGVDQVPMSALILGDYKVLRMYETGTTHLYNLSDDIGEARDLAKKMPDKARELSRRLDAYLGRVKAQLPTRNPDYDPNAPRQRAGPGAGKQSNPFIGRLDKDADGKVSRAEFTGPRRRFILLDQNNDGYLEADEIPDRR